MSIAANRDYKMNSKYVVFEAPSPLGLWPSGVQNLASTLLEHGLAERIGATYAGRLKPPVYIRERDEKTGYINGDAVRQYSLELAKWFAPSFNEGKIPVILGGDCSVMHGAMIALKRTGRFGLLYLDGHADFFDSKESTSGEIADMGLAIATGFNNDFLADIDNLKPYIKPEDAVSFGMRDETVSLAEGMQSIRDRGILVLDLKSIQDDGFTAALAETERRLSTFALQGTHVHFDTDVLNDAINPAVDYRLPDGLSYDQVVHLMQMTRRIGKLSSMSVSIFNPNRDPDGTIAMALTDCLVEGLRD